MWEVWIRLVEQIVIIEMCNAMPCSFPSAISKVLSRRMFMKRLSDSRKYKSECKRSDVS